MSFDTALANANDPNRYAQPGQASDRQQFSQSQQQTTDAKLQMLQQQMAQVQAEVKGFDQFNQNIMLTVKSMNQLVQAFTVRSL